MKHPLDHGFPISPTDEVTPYSDEERYAFFETVAQKRLDDLRVDRDKKLTESDWTQGNDSPLSEEKKIEWQTYRQALRDITDNYSNLEDVEWPTKPS